MAEVVLLDAGPLGMISHPRPVDEIAVWVAHLLGSGVEVLVPEIADYEVRRELRAGKSKSVRRLDQLKVNLGYVPISTEAMVRAAGFWADARKRGRPTTHDLSLDADAILAGQAAVIEADVVIATTNPRHLARFVPAEHWQDIS